jgi:ABC-type glycerol-3-phosphate transport system permease component
MTNIINKFKQINTQNRFAAKKHTRSTAGNILVWTFLAAVGFFLALPLVYAISSSLKPYNEIFIFPPKIWLPNLHLITLKNFLS